MCRAMVMQVGCDKPAWPSRSSREGGSQKVSRFPRDVKAPGSSPVAPEMIRFPRRIRTQFVDSPISWRKQLYQA
jgi:hypothetical protein